MERMSSALSTVFFLGDSGIKEIKEIKEITEIKEIKEEGLYP